MNNNHKEFNKKIIDDARSVRLTAGEKAEGRNDLVKFMNTHPVSDAKAVKSPYFLTSSLWIRSGAVAVLLIVIMGGTAFAAQKALPGDVLYPVKIHFNEGLASLFTFGASNNAKLNQDEIAERLQETEVLSAEGRLSPQAKAELTASLLTNTQDFDQHVAEIAAASDTPEAVSLAEGLSATLKLHLQALQTLGIEKLLDTTSASSTATTTVSTNIQGTSTPPQFPKKKRHVVMSVSSSSTSTITEPIQGPVIRIFLSPEENASASATVPVPTVVIPPISIILPPSLHL